MRTRFLEATEISLNDRMQAVRTAVNAAYNQAPGEYSYVEVVFDAYVVLCKQGKLWRVDYTTAADGTVAFSGDPQQVRVTYTPVTEGTIFGLLPDVDGQTVKEGEAAPAPTGKRWGVLIIQEGMSKNRNRYSRKVLQEAAPLYEGAAMYVDHEETPRRYGRSLKDKAGFLRDVEGVLLGGGKEAHEANGPGTFALAATAVVLKKALREEMLDAAAEGNPGFFGLSHDASCESVAVVSPDGPFYDVRRIAAVDSVDLVGNPAAGGRVLRLVASAVAAPTLQEDAKMLQKLIEAIKASGNAGLVAKLEALGASPNEDQIMALYAEALTAGVAPVAAPVPAAAPAREAVTTPVAQPAAALSRISEAEIRDLQRDAITLFVENTVNGTSLPDPVKDSLRKRFSEAIAAEGGALPSKPAILAAVKEQVDLFGLLAERNIVLPANGRPHVQVLQDRRDKVVEALDGFFGVKQGADGKVSLIPGAPMISFRNLYVEITGDERVTGLTKEAKRLTESLTSSSFDQILGDSITRRMVAEYTQAPMTNWRGVVAEVVPVSDFRTQRRMRFGGYGNLSTVAQGAPYPAMTSPTDEEATYAPSKRGGTEQITLEMIANDDVGVIRRIPQKMARAAAQTLHEFVWDFLATNAAIYDSVALSAAGHSNDSTTALSSSQLTALRLKIKNQADMSNSKRLGLAARFLIVPSDLEELAFQLTTSDRVVPDSSISSTAQAAAPNFVRKLGIQPVVVDYWTDANNWWISADPSQVPMIEIGFLSGREEPELFVQDTPNVGSLFSNDAITYKIRHIYGGAVLDYRGFAGAIVA